MMRWKQYNGLLDLYNKKKEELDKEKEKNKELKDYLEKYHNAELFSAKQLKFEEGMRKKYYIHKDKIREVIKKHEEARDIAGEQLTTRVVVADSDSLNYGRIQAHNVAIKDLQELLEE